ncbi:hypothetical protein B0H17DRAFT_1216784 [Mycena rosella]|uniref:Integrase zinc-binding domain-containing protein n=1 Tax=Mycena rosella TaxID=1033263 RepID=A0AAD7C5V8_MYCRO|nr:hypothetical protein B0H17DRAFT_1216784 [Mycena rosella]
MAPGVRPSARLNPAMEPRDAEVAEMDAHPEPELGLEPDDTPADDPTEDALLESICAGYQTDSFFSIILKEKKLFSSFSIEKDMIYTRNRDRRGALLQQAHNSLGHFGPQRTGDYLRRWYWWPKVSQEVQTFCDSWLQTKFMPPTHRLLIHYLSLEYFVMHDFLAQALSVIARHRDDNRVALAKCESTSLSNLEYDPWYAFTLRFRNLRGANLYKVLSLERPVDRPKSQCPSHDKQVDRARVDKLLLEVMSMPGLYEDKIDELQTMVCDTFAPGPWPRASVQSITLDGVVNAMADMGVQIDRVDDAWAHQENVFELAELAPALPTFQVARIRPGSISR